LRIRTDFAKKDAPSIREPAHVAALLKDLPRVTPSFRGSVAQSEISFDRPRCDRDGNGQRLHRQPPRRLPDGPATQRRCGHRRPQPPERDTTPSAEDVAVTRQTVAAGKTVEIKCLDSIIVGRTDEETPTAYSLREAGLVEFA
jgi:hypothetical protein